MNTQTQTAPNYNQINTLQIAKRLIAVGMERKIAEEQAEIFDDIATHNLASKLDIEAVRSDLKETESRLTHDLKETESRLELKIAETKTDLIKFILLNTGVIIAVLGFLIKFS